MKKEIDVSVIIAAYNAAKWLPQCLSSITNQTLQNIEIICVDDGSEDDTLSILREYERADSRIQAVSQKHRSAGTARNTGLAMAKGKYLSFLDADDFFEHDMLEKCVAQLEKDHSDIVIFSASMYHEETGKSEYLPWSCKKEYLPDKTPFTPDQIKGYLFNAFQNWAWNKVFRRELIVSQGILFQDIPRTNDMAFVCEALSCASLISVIDKPFAHYRTGTGSSLQSSNHLTPLAFSDAFRETKLRLEKRSCYQKFEQSYLNWILEGLLHNLRSNKDPFAKLYVMCYTRFDFEPSFGLMNHPDAFYYSPQLFDEYKAILESDDIPYIEALNPNFVLQEELSSIKSSKAYRLSLFLAWLPRRIKSFLFQR